MTSWHFLQDKYKHLSSNNYLGIEPFVLEILLFCVVNIWDILCRKNFWELPDLELVRVEERDPLKILLIRFLIKT